MTEISGLEIIKGKRNKEHLSIKFNDGDKRDIPIAYNEYKKIVGELSIEEINAALTEYQDAQEKHPKPVTGRGAHEVLKATEPLIEEVAKNTGTSPIVAADFIKDLTNAIHCKELKDAGQKKNEQERMESLASGVKNRKAVADPKPRPLPKDQRNKHRPFISKSYRTNPKGNQQAEKSEVKPIPPFYLDVIENGGR
ncbi:MAG: hypothetical protein GY804_08100 [Alphaproteobacteria bacterium]|nr:hypothetical protein [Alphaproteobacteria bacterium]